VYAEQLQSLIIATLRVVTKHAVTENSLKTCRFILVVPPHDLEGAFSFEGLPDLVAGCGVAFPNELLAARYYSPGL
jgi:hypothetical protein